MGVLACVLECARGWARQCAAPRPGRWAARRGAGCSGAQLSWWQGAWLGGCRRARAVGTVGGRLGIWVRGCVLFRARGWLRGGSALRVGGRGAWRAARVRPLAARSAGWCGGEDRAACVLGTVGTLGRADGRGCVDGRSGSCRRPRVRRGASGRTGFLTGARAFERMVGAMAQKTATVITMFAAKGGVGKSVSAWLLAWTLHELGFRVAIFDCDDETKTARMAAASLHPKWAGQPQPAVRVLTQLKLEEFRKVALPAFDYILIDTPAGGRTMPALFALDLADVIISPFIPDETEMLTIGESMEALMRQQVKNPRAVCKFLFTGVNESRKDHREALTSLKEMPELNAFRTYLHVSRAIGRSVSHHGGPLSQFRRHSGGERAMEEVNEIVMELFDVIEQQEAAE